MTVFHRHHWQERRRYHVPPAESKFHVEGFDAERVTEEALHGFTVVELACECGEIAERHLTGDAT